MIITELFLFKFVFVLEILIAMFYFSFRQKKKRYPVLRYIAVTIGCLLVAFIFPLFEGFSYTWWYSSLMFLFLFLVCMGGFYFVLDVSWQKVFFISIASYTAQHLAYQFYGLVTHIFKNPEVSGDSLYGSSEVVFSVTQITIIFTVLMMLFYLLTYNLIYLLFIDKINKNDAKMSSVSIVSLSGVILLIDIVFNAVVVYNGSDDQVTSIILCLYNIVCCFLVLFIQFNLMNIRQLRTELFVTSQLLHKKEEQFNQNKETISLINLKCHDLKHQIHRYIEKGQVSFDVKTEIENMIDIYDSTVTTGNEALDLILTEKSLVCKQKNINLKCYADCSKLGFISEVDLYSLFGNALDNAIEAVCKLDDNRNINLIVKNVLSFVTITIENYFDGNVTLDKDGFPITTKASKHWHGYGIKSIKYIIDKYNGNFEIKTDDNIFSLGILLPLEGKLKD